MSDAILRASRCLHPCDDDSNYKYASSFLYLVASRKGVIITGAILAAITTASFIVWLLPQGGPAIFETSDYGYNLDAVAAIHRTLESAISSELQVMEDGGMNPAEYVFMAETATSQNNAQIVQLLSTNPPDEWFPSYEAYVESLRAFNSYIRETIVYAQMIQEDRSAEEISGAYAKAEEYRNIMNEFATLSDNARP